MAPAPVSAPVSTPVSTPVSAPLQRVVRIQIDGQMYLRSSDNVLYDAVTWNEVGIWNPETRTIMSFSDDDDDDDSDYDGDESDDDDEEEGGQEEEPENTEVSFRP
jgi:hypothetical protein